MDLITLRTLILRVAELRVVERCNTSVSQYRRTQLIISHSIIQLTYFKEVKCHNRDTHKLFDLNSVIRKYN